MSVPIISIHCILLVVTGTRKIELFGRPHNVQPNWVTLGNQLDGVLIHDEAMLARWHKEYGNNGYNICEDIFLYPRQKP